MFGLIRGQMCLTPNAPLCLLVGLPRSVDQPLVVVIRLGGDAEIFPQLRVWPEFDFAFGYPRPRENLWVCNCYLGLQRPVACAPVTLDGPHLIGMWKSADAIPSVLGDPGSIVITVSFYDESVSLPSSNGISQPTLLWRIVGHFPAVGPDVAPRVAPFKKLEHSVGQHHELKSVVICEQARIA